MAMPFRLIGLCLVLIAGHAAANPTRVGNTQAGASSLLKIYSTADVEAIRPALEAYVSIRSDILIEYYELFSQDIFTRVEAEIDSTADFVWSSAMDLQMKLVNDGYARPVNVVQGRLPDWALWRNEAFAVSVEPAVMVYNRNIIADEVVPRNRAELVAWLENSPEAFGAVGTYDIERSGLGLLLAARDAQRSSDFWRLISAMGHNQVDLFSSSSALIERVVDGRLGLAYNVIGSYAAVRSAQDERLGIVLPDDYTLIVSRIAFVPQNAANPELGEDFLRYLLSLNGQRVLNNQVGFPAVHRDVAWPQKLFPSATRNQPFLDPLGVDTGLLVYLDRVRRETLIRRWREALNRAL